MSVQAVEWAMYRAPMLLTEKKLPDSTARQVLAVLAEHANDEGHNAFPSPLRIRFATGLDERTIQRALARLERGGLISRDGLHRSGAIKWRLHLDKVRPDSDMQRLEAEAEEARRLDSERRKARRHRAADVSGTENPGQAEDVRDAESGRPARKIPASGTQSTDVRDAAPPEPSVEPPLNHQKEPPSLSPRESSPPPVVAEDRERDQMDQSSGPETSWHRWFARNAGIADPERADQLLYAADHLMPDGKAKGRGWWNKVHDRGDLPDVIADLDALLAAARFKPDPPQAGTPPNNGLGRFQPTASFNRTRGRFEPFRNPDPADYDLPL